MLARLFCYLAPMLRHDQPANLSSRVASALEIEGDVATVRHFSGNRSAL